jgi:hypothetical protein
MIFPLFKTWLAPYLPSSIRSSSNNKAYKNPGSGFVTIGGGGVSSQGRRGPESSRRITASMTFDNESGEHIVKGNEDVRMHTLSPTGGTTHPMNTIVVSKQISVTTEDGSSERSAESFQRV